MRHADKSHANGNKCASGEEADGEANSSAGGARVEQLVAHGELLRQVSREHKQILQALKASCPELAFPELYVEIFQIEAL